MLNFLICMYVRIIYYVWYKLIIYFMLFTVLLGVRDNFQVLTSPFVPNNKDLMIFVSYYFKHSLQFIKSKIIQFQHL